MSHWDKNKSAPRKGCRALTDPIHRFVWWFRIGWFVRDHCKIIIIHLKGNCCLYRLYCSTHARPKAPKDRGIPVRPMVTWNSDSNDSSLTTKVMSQWESQSSLQKSQSSLQQFDSSLTERRVTFADSHRPGSTPRITISKSRKTTVAERRVELERVIKATARAAKKATTESAKAQAMRQGKSFFLSTATATSQPPSCLQSFHHWSRNVIFNPVLCSLWRPRMRRQALQGQLLGLQQWITRSRLRRVEQAWMSHREGTKKGKMTVKLICATSYTTPALYMVHLRKIHKDDTMPVQSFDLSGISLIR